MAKKRFWDHVLPTLIFITVAFVLSTSTRFSYYSKESFGHDAGIFAYIGYALTQGRTLYIGAWDNKGPLLYFIQALGILINYRYGIYLLELITLTLSAFFLYKTALLFTSRWTAVVCSVFCMMTLTVTLMGGNTSEEYALPFTIGGFYYICKFFRNNFSLKKWEMMVVGGCMAAVFLIRLNILAFFCCAVLGVIYALLKERKFDVLGQVTLFAFLGFVLFLAPFVIYLVANGAFAACMGAAYFGALGAFTPIAPIVTVKATLELIIALIPAGSFQMILLFMVLFTPALFRRDKDAQPMKYLCGICYFGVIATVLANSLSGAAYRHYYISMVPVLIIPAIWFAVQIEDCCKKWKCSPQTSTVICLALTVVLCSSAIPEFYTGVASNLQDGTGSHYSERYRKVSDYIVMNSDPDDTVQVMGDGTSPTSYYRSKRLAASNHPYFNGGRFTDEMRQKLANEICKDVLAERPKLIMFSHQWRMNDFAACMDQEQLWWDLLEEEYTLQENDFEYVIYKRNE